MSGTRLSAFHLPDIYQITNIPGIILGTGDTAMKTADKELLM